MKYSRNAAKPFGWFSAVLLALLCCVPRSASALPDISNLSPQYTEFNTFLQGENILELLSVGTVTANVTITIFRLDGSVGTETVSIPVNQQMDIMLNPLINQGNTYGVIRITFNNVAGARVQGRVAVYRMVPSDMGDFSFAYTLPLRLPLTDPSFQTANSYDPSNRSFIFIPNWLSISNLESTPETFTHNIYNQAGMLVASNLRMIPANTRTDFEATVGTDQQVFLNEVIPTNPGIEFLSSIIRYGSNSSVGAKEINYSFAMPVFGKPGSGDTEFMPIYNQEANCFRQLNWVEVVNVTNLPVNGTLTFRDQNGVAFPAIAIPFNPHGQFHFNASMMLDTRSLEGGIAIIDTDTPNSIIAQSVVYYLDCSKTKTQTGYNIQSDTPPSPPLLSSFNTFLNQRNELTIFGAAGTANRTVSVVLGNGGGSDSVSLPNFESTVLDLSVAPFTPPANNYGIITLNAVPAAATFGYNLRIRPGLGNGINYAIPIPAL